MNEQRPSNSLLERALGRVAVYREDPDTLLPYARSMIALADEIERLQRALSEMTAAWRACCQGEVAKKLAAESTAHEPAASQVDELAMLVRRLVQSLRTAKPDSELPAQALDYLQRKGLTGSILRTSEPPGGTRDRWMAWHVDGDEAWLVALLGSYDEREQIESAIRREQKDRPRDFVDVYPVRVTVHLGTVPTKPGSDDAPQFFRNKDGDIDFGPSTATETSASRCQYCLAPAIAGGCGWPTCPHKSTAPSEGESR